MKSNLPSITTRNPGDERSGAKSTSETSIINIPESRQNAGCDTDGE